MVFGFAIQSDGHVSIDSVPGSGTTVRVYLPRASANAVVESEDDHRLAGTLFETDVMAAYNRALIEARHEEHDTA